MRASAPGVAAHVVFVVSVLVAHHGDPSWFVRFGVDAPQASLARQVIGPILTHPGVGADGQYFWILARDPLLIHPSAAAAGLDRPVYRAQRVAYPALAAPWRALGERALLWGLLLENVAVVAVGSYLTARLALALGLPARTALAFAFNPGVLFAVMFDLSDALALAATIGALYAAASRRTYALLTFSILAGLAKEPAALALGAVALAGGSRWANTPPLERRIRALLVVPSLVAIGSWGIYVRSRLDWSAANVVEFAPPFAGLARALTSRWLPEGLILEPVIGFLLVIGAGAVVVLFVRRRSLLLAAAVPYALLVPFMSEHVMMFGNNALRAFAPAFTFLWLEAYRPWRKARI